MKYILTLKLILLFLILALLTSCVNCPKNYTTTIRAIMKPMKANLENFFAQEQVYPNNRQRDTLLEASGCKILNPNQQTCRYKGTTFSYESNKGILYPEPAQVNTNYSEPNRTTTEVTPQEPEREEGIEIYTFAIVKDESHCSVDMTFDGKMLNINCIQQSCLKIDP